MALVLDGTNGVSGVDGTASNPAIEGTDSNTGIFYPAADTVAIGTGGTERLRVDSAGNAGLGVTPAAWSLSGLSAFQVRNGGLYGYDATEVGVTGNCYYGSSSWRYIATATATRYSQANGSHAWLTAPSGTAGNAITFTQAMVLDANGNLGIGTGSPTSRLQVEGGEIYLNNTDTGQNSLVFGGVGSGGGYFYLGKRTANNSSALSIVYGTGPANNNGLFLTQGGEIYIAGTTDRGAYNLQCNGTGVWGAGAYVNGSDERIKEDIKPIASCLDVVTKLNPVTYRYKEDWSKDQSTQTGFIAQELLVAMEGQNYIDGVVQQGGSESYYNVAYQSIIPLLTKAIQEQQVMIDELKAKVAALESA